MSGEYQTGHRRASARIRATTRRPHLRARRHASASLTVRSFGAHPRRSQPNLQAKVPTRTAFEAKRRGTEAERAPLQLSCWLYRPCRKIRCVLRVAFSEIPRKPPNSFGEFPAVLDRHGPGGPSLSRSDELGILPWRSEGAALASGRRTPKLSTRNRTISHCTHHPRSARALCRTARVFSLVIPMVCTVPSKCTVSPRNRDRTAPLFFSQFSACTAVEARALHPAPRALHLAPRAPRFPRRECTCPHVHCGSRRARCGESSCHTHRRRHAIVHRMAAPRLPLRVRGSSISSIDGHRLFLKCHSPAFRWFAYDYTKMRRPLLTIEIAVLTLLPRRGQGGVRGRHPFGPIW